MSVLRDKYELGYRLTKKLVIPNFSKTERANLGRAGGLRSIQSPVRRDGNKLCTNKLAGTSL
jgi:hypothetical protein